jgi:hypothetical protein
MGERDKLPVDIGEAFRQAADDALAVLVDMARTGSTAATKALRDRGLVSAQDSQEGSGRAKALTSQPERKTPFASPGAAET